MNILLVDDDIDTRAAVADFLRQLGHHVTECKDGIEALEKYKTGNFPMILTDIRMPRMDGIELLKAISKLPNYSETDVVIFTGHGDLDTAISALRAGAYDYLLKPLNVEELAMLVERIGEHQSLRRENKKLTEQFDSEVEAATKETREEAQRLRKMMAAYTGVDFIGIFSKQMRQILEQTQKYHVDRSIPVIIEGETGTGKEIVARLIHFGKSGTTITNFIDINCAALTPTLFESELFGYEAGSYTGGLAKGQKGKIDLAKGGTLFLDEITEIPLELQGKLLRVIQEKEFYRVGGLKKIEADVRIICATNINLEKQVAEGKFRKDLYYRLKVGHIKIPPLCQRPEDIIGLSKMFLKKFAKEKKKSFTTISQEAEKLLLSYSWPGNVRELKNVIEWAVFMYDDTLLKPSHIKLEENNKSNNLLQQVDSNGFSLPDDYFPLNEFVDEVIEEALEKHKGNKAKTARYLGISRRSLYSHLERMSKSSQKKD